MKNNILNVIKVAIIISSVLSFLWRNMFATFIFLLVLFLLLVVDILWKKIGYSFSIQVLLYIFIITSEVLGEIFYFYSKVWYFDIIMHIYSSFIISSVCASFIKNIDFKLSLIFIFSFAMMIASVWEITEFTIDRLFNKDMQKDTVINEISSTLFSYNRLEASTRKINSVRVNNVDFINVYGGYIDIGLYDTMEDMICAFIGSIIYLLLYIKKVKLIN